MNILFTILYILLFLVCLSFLIIVHELGHLTAAKAFKVYCIEFSCGMGPLLWKHKKKGAETQFSLRAIPFGGYVAMYGEGVELPEGVEVDSSRSLTGIKKWKRAIILVAGVTMNAILALLIFTVKNACFEQQQFIYINEVSVVENSKAYDAGIRDEDIIAYDNSFESNEVILLGTTDKDNRDITTTTICYLNYENGDVKEVGVGLTPVQSFKNPVFTYTLYGIESEKVVSTEIVQLTSETKSLDINVKTKNESGAIADHNISLNITDGVLEDSGLRIYINNFRYTFGEAIGQSFADFGNSSTAIVKSIAGLFTGEVDASQFSGVVGMGFEAKNILDELGVPMFIYLWGLISVNLAVINLLPFPGLDGWQLLVCAIEGIFNKKVSNKVQSIVSFIGIGLLLLLMVVILFKDLWVYVFKGLLGGILLL